LREEHEKAIEALVEMRVSFGFEKLDAEVYMSSVGKREQSAYLQAYM
jgi:hypothetical protein|tara:strand:- start:36772 stop:36912 length:141 start_codon:yes stop_codon:yes gene_type:complete